MLDESTSMKGENWQVATSGVKGLIEEIKEQRKTKESQKKVQLELIFFANEPRRVWSNSLDKNIPTRIWDMDGGYTYYGKALKKAFAVIHEKIANYESAMLYFFTDGHAGPDIEAMLEIAGKVEA